MIARENLRELLYKYYEAPFAAFFDHVWGKANPVKKSSKRCFIIFIKQFP
jgi:hypothetical protein